MKDRKQIVAALALWALASVARHAFAEPVKVRYPQGSAHGFVEVTTLDGKRIGIGDLIQKTHGGIVSSRLTLNFFDGSLDDETTVFSQRDNFRLISDRHVQQGPSFPKASTTLVEVRTGNVTLTDADGKVTRSHIDMPADVYNGMASTVLMNLMVPAPETKISIVIPLSSPRIAQLSIKQSGEVAYAMGGEPRKALQYVVHVELGGVAGVVAPVIGKEPADFHVLLSSGGVPAFIREEGQLYAGGPIWRIQQISATFPGK